VIYKITKTLQATAKTAKSDVYLVETLQATAKTANYYIFRELSGYVTGGFLRELFRDIQ